MAKESQKQTRQVFSFVKHSKNGSAIRKALADSSAEGKAHPASAYTHDKQIRTKITGLLFSLYCSSSARDEGVEHKNQVEIIKQLNH